jgi:hydroxymethylbilane synthase
LPSGLCLGAITEREDPRDVLISKNSILFSQLPKNACIGTSSLRRKAQLLHLRPDFKIVPLRGNVDTRLRKLKNENLDAIIMASAGLKRMGLEKNITEYLPFEVILPAIGQGALAIEIKEETKWQDIVSPLDHLPTALVAMAERAFLRRLHGGCQVPIAAYAEIKDGKLSLTGIVAETNGRRLLKQKISGLPKQAEDLGTALAESLLDAGAKEILTEVYGDR